MTVQHLHYLPKPRGRPVRLIRKDLHARLHGKPTYNSPLLSIPRGLGMLLRRLLVLIIISLVLTAVLLFNAGIGMLVGYVNTASPIVIEQIKNKNETTRITDADGNDIAILTGSQNINREYVPLASIKATWIDEAFKAIEDERFDQHIGIDPRRIASAVLSALMNGGSATHGGSTITQQTVRLVSGESQRSAQRKVQEWYKAILLEQQKSKDEIMELYINLVPMGNSYIGVQSAAKAYFDKDAASLSLVECAFLAGIPNRPSTYNPLTETGRRNALRRMRIVLGKMNQLGMITAAEYRAALDTELVFRKRPAAVTATQVNSYFADYVIEKVIGDLITRRGYNSTMAAVAVYNYGLRIETTLDSAVQAKIEQTFNEQSLFLSDPAILVDLPEKPEGSIVVIGNGPSIGQIKGMVGGYGRKTGNFVLNRAISAYRQPGSSIKPLDVYGPGLETGKITAASIFTDRELFLNPDEPAKAYPVNSYTGYRGNMSVRQAITISCNTIAAQAWLYVLGADTSLLYLYRVGIDRRSEQYVSVALGGFNKGMSTLEMAGAYATFANDGVYTVPYAYSRVLDADGNVLLENQPHSTQVYKPETAYVLTSMLQDVLTRGTAAGHGISGQVAAGKTGTTDDNRDKWFCGYTAYYTAAVWYGYDNRLGQTTIPKGDRSNAILIWQDAMTRIHDGLAKTDFAMPERILQIKICKDSGLLATPLCKSTATEYFIPGAFMNPTANCSLHATAVTPAP